MISLPGGLCTGDGRIEREAELKEVTGAVELAVAACSSSATIPVAVTGVLAAALERLGEEAATPERVRALCVDDRRFLMARLAAALGRGGGWITGVCGECKEPFDVYVDAAALPVKNAGAGYPRARVSTSLGDLGFRVPTGADQEATAGLDPSEAVAALATRLCEDRDAGGWTDDDLAAIDAAVEDVSPRVATTVATACPECGAEAELPLDHYTVLGGRPLDVFEDVHALASAYGWGESEILGLPRDRRGVYLDLVADEATR